MRPHSPLPASPPQGAPRAARGPRGAWAPALLLAGAVACEPGKGGLPEAGGAGLGGAGVSDGDGDGFLADEDCNDRDAAVHPAAVELCDGIDNDCDGDVDEGLLEPWYLDEDGDGFGDPRTAVEACAAPAGRVPRGDDCDDARADVHPGADDACDGVDNDCDGLVDGGASAATWHRDADGDGYGDPGAAVEACDPPAGHTAEAGDCDDADPASHPGADEVCDAADNDCDGDVDEGVTLTWYQDADGDGWGRLEAPVEACALPPGYAAAPGDCDDGELAVHPDADEVCNGVDDDCDGDLDDADVDVLDAARWYADADGDTFGDAGAALDACAAPLGHVADNTDCDDDELGIFPGADEVCDGLDNDCDAAVDDADPDLLDPTPWYADADLDGVGAGAPIWACAAPAGAVADGADCDDADLSVYPGAPEACDGLDNDCDGDDDEGVLGTGAACPAVDCAEILTDNPSAGSGAWQLFAGVYTCDMTTDGGGWTRVKASAPIWGTGYDNTGYNSEGFTWDEVMVSHASGSVHAHCTWPTDLPGCNNLGLRFGSESWGLPLNWGASLCGLGTVSYASATRYPGGQLFVISRTSSTDLVRVGTLEGIAACTTSDNPGSAWVDVWVRR